MLLLAASLAGCGGTGAGGPPAVKPIIDAIHASGLLVKPQERAGPDSGCLGDRYLLEPFGVGSQLTLFITNVPTPSGIEVAVDDVLLRSVDPNTPFGGKPGYKVVVDTSKTPTEWRVLVSPERAAPFMLRVRDVSVDTSLGGRAKISDPALVQIADTLATSGCNASNWIARAVPGGWIAFTSSRSGSNEVWAMRGDETWGGADLHKVSSGEAHHPVIGPPDAKGALIGIAFESSRSSPSDIFEGTIDRSGDSLAAHDAVPDTDPVFLSNSTLLYVSAGEIWNNTAAGPLTNTHVEAAPAPSPDGTKIAYLRSGQLWIMNADGSSKASLAAPSAGLDASPVFSPDSMNIAFISSGQLWIVPANNTSAPVPQGLAGGGTAAHASWSRDGSYIAIESWHPICTQTTPCPNAQRSADIWVLNVSTKQWTQLTTGGDNFAPAWAPVSINPANPNDTRIAFVSKRDGNREIYVMNADGSGQRNLTNNPADDFDVVWR